MYLLHVDRIIDDNGPTGVIMMGWVNHRCLQMILNVCLFNSHCKISPFIFDNVGIEHWCLGRCAYGNGMLFPSIHIPKYMRF